MTGFIVLSIVALLAVVAIQVGKISDLFTKIHGEEETERRSNEFHSRFGVAFMILFLVGSVVSAWYYKNYMMGYGPHESASVHGAGIHGLWDQTVFFTGIIFVATQIALFWFAFQFRGRKTHKAQFISHDNRLEVIWTAIPAVVMCYLVVQGLLVWNNSMADVKPGEDHIEIEATGYQFAWNIRYPGADGALGKKNFKLINPGKNDLGQDWTDQKNFDDFNANEIVLPVGKKIRVRITSKDVLHNFYLPHFQVKMDAIPGLPTYFVFTPIKTTEQYRLELKKYDEYNVPADPKEPNGPRKWEVFNYELACAELCGKGHFSMQKIVKIVSMEEYQKWLTTQKSTYESTVKGTDDDPWKNKVTEVKDFSVEAAETAKVGEHLELNNVNFATGSAKLTPESVKELDLVVAAMQAVPAMKVEIGGHTDNAGDAAKNVLLSDARAKAVLAYVQSKGIAADRMMAKGYGSGVPVAPNDSPENMKKNRRTEFVIASK